ADLFGRVFGNLHAEGFLERHHQLDRIEAVRTEIVDKGRLRRDLRLLDAKMLDHDLLNLVSDLAHPNCNSWLLGPVPDRPLRCWSRREDPIGAAPLHNCRALSMVSSRQPTPGRRFGTLR